MSKRAVVLFSGGLDSLACLKWAIREGYEVTPLYIDYGSKYAQKEIEAASRILEVSYSYLNLRILELDLLDASSDHVPFRNVLFILSAVLTYRPDVVVFGMLRNEMPADKNPAFIRLMQKLINSQLKESIYGIEKKCVIATPFKWYSKTQLVAWLLQHNDSGMLMSVGCFEATTKQCGACVSCFHRWVALYNNEIYYNDYELTHPAKAMFADLSRGKLSGAYSRATLRNVFKKRRMLWESYAALSSWCRDNGTTFWREFMKG